MENLLKKIKNTSPKYIIFVANDSGLLFVTNENVSVKNRFNILGCFSFVARKSFNYTEDEFRNRASEVFFNRDSISKQ